MPETLHLITKNSTDNPMVVLRTYADIVLEQSGHGPGSDLAVQFTDAIDLCVHDFNEGRIPITILRSLRIIELLGLVGRNHDFSVSMEGAATGLWVLTTHD